MPIIAAIIVIVHCFSFHFRLLFAMIILIKFSRGKSLEKLKASKGVQNPLQVVSFLETIASVIEYLLD